ncbi:hypothetical protein [Nocardia cyriacigeorgica]|nr:hypothetical protein [Nocardia cyriacigeorgica]
MTTTTGRLATTASNLLNRIDDISDLITSSQSEAMDDPPVRR